MLVALVGMNLVIPRFFCRVLCPLGAFLGVLSRFALWRIDRDVTKCTDCNLCLRHCEGASDPQAALRKSECFVCFNCIDDCPEDALSFRLAPVPIHKRIIGSIKDGTAKLFGRKVISKIPETEIAPPAVPRRRWVLAAVVGVLTYPFLRYSKAVNKRSFNDKAIRPPGTVAEEEFLERCIKCDQCINVCPTNVLQPSTLFEGGLEGLWTPVMDFKTGLCQLNCTLCSEVCPTGAIQKISLAEKLGLGEYKEKGPIRLGTAFFNQGRCLPWAMQTPCVVCEEVCPTSPKAIGTYQETITRWDGTEGAAQQALHAPRALHRLRHLRARVPRHGRPRRLRHRHRRDPFQGPHAAARKPQEAGDLNMSQRSSQRSRTNAPQSDRRPESPAITRRQMLSQAGAAGGGLVLASALGVGPAAIAAAPVQVPRRVLGKTGETIPILCMGGSLAPRPALRSQAGRVREIRGELLRPGRLLFGRGGRAGPGRLPHAGQPALEDSGSPPRATRRIPRASRRPSTRASRS